MVNATEPGAGNAAVKDLARDYNGQLCAGLARVIARGQAAGDLSAALDPAALACHLATLRIGLRVVAKLAPPRQVYQQVLASLDFLLNK